MLNINEVISALEARGCKPKRTGKGWLAHCPAHDDRRPSLSITEEDGKALINCFAGCNFYHIIERLGLRYNGKDEIGKPEAIYDYLDEKGNLLFQVLRFSGKQFKQRRPDGNGKWVYNIKGVPRVLYNLPNVVKAVAKGEKIFIVEGEKDANNLTKLGLTATTAPGGAGKWREEYNEYLKGANIVILPDNDKIGKEYAQQIANSVYKVAKSVKIVSLPGLEEKEDVSDWLAKGGSKAELLHLVSQTPEWKPPQPKSRLVSLAEIEGEEIAWAWYPYVPFGKITLLEGDPGVGKTFVALAIAARLTREGLPVLYISLEDAAGDTLRPRAEIVGADLGKLMVPSPEEGLFSLEDLGDLEEEIQRAGIKMVVVDPLQGLIGPAVDFHKANEIRAALAPLAKLAEKTGAAVLLVRHLNKSRGQRAIYRGLGSIDVSALARSILLVAEKDGRKYLAQVKNNLAPVGETLSFEIREGGNFWGEPSHLSASDLLADELPEEKGKLEEAKEFLRELLCEGPVEVNEVHKAGKKLGFSEATLRRARKELGVKAVRVSDPRSGRAQKWVLKLPKPGDQGLYKKRVDHLDLGPQSLDNQGFRQGSPDDHPRKGRPGDRLDASPGAEQEGGLWLEF